jgi:hypothetical protein
MENTCELEIRADLNFRSEYANIFIDYSQVSDEWKFESYSRSCGSDQNSGDMWHPQKRQTKKSKKQKQT